jgi:dolichol-phosphate mannosyltransferase
VDLSLILPTYNERGGLGALRGRIEAVLRPYSAEIIVVDDDSPDGTAAYVSGLANGGLWKLIVRKSCRGLASAAMVGFEAARGDILVVMDSDGSHPPESIPALVEPIRAGRAEFVLASRFVPGGSDVGLVGLRRAVSWGAAELARPLTPVRDPMSGFFACRRDLLQRCELAPVGYKIGLEILVRCRPHPFEEVPFRFAPRLAGVSKLGSRQVLGFVRHLARLYRWQFAGDGRASSTR